MKKNKNNENLVSVGDSVIYNGREYEVIGFTTYNGRDGKKAVQIMDKQPLNANGYIKNSIWVSELDLGGVF